MVDPAPSLPVLSQVYQGLVLATRDYVRKNGFQGALLGLSGGIDSGLTVAIAADALGKDKVQAVMMPFRYTSDISIHDAREQAELLVWNLMWCLLSRCLEAFMHELAPKFAGTPV